ncbi:MAG: tetratricopeptide repeat protein [Elusimicrobiota bacterium]
MKKYYIIFFIGFIPLAKLFSEDTPQTLYKNSQYEQALAAYQSMDYKNNPYLLYNIANCYYKLGSKAEATVYYLKAFKLLPRNKDIRENLLKVTQENEQQLFSPDIPMFAYKIYYFFSDIEISVLFELFFTISILLIIIHTRRKDDKLMGYILLSSFLFSLFFLWHLLRKNSILSNPAVTLNETTIYSGPKKTFNTLAVIPKGKIITILSEDDENYIEVGVPQENIKGWVEKNYIAKVND